VLGRRKNRNDNHDDPANPYEGLRAMALRAVSSGLALPPPDHPDVSGLVVDVPAEGGFATVVALTDNTTSMYTSTGGGTIGAGEHRDVADANHRLLTIVEAHLGSFDRKDDGSLPPKGTVRLHVVTPSGNRSKDVSEDSFWGRSPGPLMPVITAVQELITAIRAASPG
jgi:hypothetical protein